MTSFIEAAPSAAPADLTSALSAPHGHAAATAPRRPLVTPLSRVRGGTFSATVDRIRFADGSFAHTDLIRLTPNIDAYSLDFTGTSPRQLSHYREGGWWAARVPAAVRRQAEIAWIVANSYPRVPTAELARRLAEAGYPVGSRTIQPHEAIAATQAALWRFTNGLTLDDRPLGAPVAAHARIGEHPSRRRLEHGSTGVDWSTIVPAGQEVHLEFELDGQPVVEAFGFRLGRRAGQQGVRVHLERSHDGVEWTPVSHSGVHLGGFRRPDVLRRLGHGATVSASSAATGVRGHRFYRLTARSLDGDTATLDLRDARLHLHGSRFHNSEQVVHLHDLLVAGAERARGQDPHPDVRVLIGARTPDGPGVFTPLVALVPPQADPAAEHQVVRTP